MATIAAPLPAQIVQLDFEGIVSPDGTTTPIGGFTTGFSFF
jgi:hypothetical protein